MRREGNTSWIEGQIEKYFQDSRHKRPKEKEVRRALPFPFRQYRPSISPGKKQAA